MKSCAAYLRRTISHHDTETGSRVCVLALRSRVSEHRHIEKCLSVVCIRVNVIAQPAVDESSTLIHRSAWNRISRKLVCKILHKPTPLPLESPLSGTPHSPAPAELVTAMDRYARLWMLIYCKLMFALRRECPTPRPAT